MYPGVDVKIDSNINTGNKKTIITAAFIAAIAIIFLLILQIIVMTLSYDKVYDGVYLNNDKVSHLSRDELRQLINNKYNEPLKTATITLTYKDMKWDIEASELKLLINEEKLIDKLYSPGHVGNIFQRLSDIVSIRMKKIQINLFDVYSDFISYDRDKINEIAERISRESFSEVVQHQVVVNNNKVTITSGRDGHFLPVDKIKEAIIRTLNSNDSFHVSLENIAVVTKPDALDPEKVAANLYVPPENAQYAKNNKQLIIKPHKYGYKVNEKELKTVIDSLNSSPDKSYTLELEKIEPQIKSDQIKLPTFNDVLGETTTRFSAGDKNRNTNIALAANTLNGIYLLPGEVFSFNQIVGDTTPAKGYKPATTFLNGKLVEDYGGGVCQVSTTLYNAVIRAGLEIVERSPHSMIVTYVPLGMDAAIANPYKDFKFKNNTSEPILITASTTSNSITFKIKGVNHNPNREYKFEYEVLRKTDYKTVYQDDPNLEKGKTKVIQTGTPGYSVKTYRVTYIDGVKVKKEEFSTSRYNARNKIVARGTKS